MSVASVIKDLEFGNILKYFELLHEEYQDVGVQFLNLYRDKKIDKFVQYETHE